MMNKLKFLLWAFLGGRSLTTAEPSPSEGPIRGRLTILANNDLENNPALGSGAILIHQPKAYADAIGACFQLSESLWASSRNNSLSSLGSLLAYQLSQGAFAPNTTFWIEKEKDGCNCRSVDAKGSLQRTSCSASLPVLCTQSAPVSNATLEDTLPEFQITQPVGNALFTGYRDFFTWKFRGIRYAHTPQRFEYSATIRNASGPISALKAGADCSQPNTSGTSEDCLFLNIWTPSLPSPADAGTPSQNDLKPVLLYIYGGNFVGGSGKNPNLDLTNIASRGDVVAVSINHRSGNFGLMVFNDGEHTGNVAINDQINALEWVAENIAYFGGDPKRVTIAGESSGAMSCRLLLSSPKAKGLYAGAILQSDGNGGLLQPLGTLWSMEESYNFFTKTILRIFGCEDAEDEVQCLRAVPAEELANLDLDTAIAKYPVVDGKYFVTASLPLDGSGPRYAQDIPVLAAVTRDESAYLAPLQSIPWDDVTFDYWAAIMMQNRDYFRIDPEAILANLPLLDITPQSTGSELFNATIKILSYTMYTCLDMAQAYSGSKNKAFGKVYFGNFHRTYSSPSQAAPCHAPQTPDRPFGDPDGSYYRCHGGSQISMFGNQKRVGLPDRDGKDQDFSRLIIDYFSSFVRSGNPNPDKAYLTSRGYTSTLHQIEKVGAWEEVKHSSPELMVLDWDGFMEPFSHAELCAVLGQPLNYWESR